MYHRLLRMLVVDAKVIDYKYFMDECQEYEIQLLCEMLPWANRQSMEETRMIMYSVSLPYMNHKKKLTEFISLSTDKDYYDQEYTKLEGEDLRNARQMVQSAFNIK